MIEYFDSHCHLTATAFRDDREAVLRRATDAGVTRMVCIASSHQDTVDALAFVRAHAAEASPRAQIWSTAGVHPHEVAEAREGDIDRIRELASGNHEIVAIGETGLDYHYDTSPRAAQRASFDAHLELGSALELPVVVHAREADADIAAAIRGMPSGTAGVLHCFTGGDEAFAAAIEAGWYVSLSGIASFRTFGPVEQIRDIPGDRLLIETDAPYLAPVPLRGRRNEPAHVVHVATAVAARLDTTVEELATRTTENARRFYGVA